MFTAWAALLLGVGLSACDATGDARARQIERAQATIADARAVWAAQKPDAYTLSYLRSCTCAESGRYTVIVSGTTVDSVLVDGEAQPFDPDAHFTVEALFDFAAANLDREPPSHQLRFAPAGYPSLAFFDFDLSNIGEEDGFTVQALTPLDP